LNHVILLVRYDRAANVKNSKVIATSDLRPATPHPISGTDAAAPARTRFVAAAGGSLSRAVSASTTTSVRMWSATDRPTMQRLEHVEDGGAVDLPFARLFGDVGAPQPVRRVGDEAPFEGGRRARPAQGRHLPKRAELVAQARPALNRGDIAYPIVVPA
jgi:hypothetical protein